MNPKATKDMTDGYTNDGGEAEDRGCFLFVNTTADLGLIMKPFDFKGFLNSKKNFRFKNRSVKNYILNKILTQ